MWRKAPRAVALALVLVGACATGADRPSAQGSSGAEAPEVAVMELARHLSSAEFGEAASLAMPGQAALASLVEGASFSDVADALERGDLAVAANFWSGFAQGAGGFLGEGFTAVETGSVSEGGVEFQTVEVTFEDGQQRLIFTRQESGSRIDIFASFGPGLADKMIPPVERLLAGQSDAADTILPELKGIVPSLEVALGQPDLSPRSTQDLLRLIELITRIN